MNEPHFYRLRKEAVGEIGCPGSRTEICGRDFLSLVPGVSNSKRSCEMRVWQKKAAGPPTSQSSAYNEKSDEDDDETLGGHSECGRITQ